MAYDGQQPATPVAAPKTCKVADGAQLCVLNHVLRLSLVAHQPARQGVCRVQVRYQQRRPASGLWKLGQSFAGNGWQVLYHGSVSLAWDDPTGWQPDRSMHRQPSLLQAFFTRQFIDGESLNGKHHLPAGLI
jgi:hypothetical protein